ncbi:MAG: hypothetical protein KAR06_03675 [Deltaproteobacteria bacterium]|nr:hypothetical protein [Deltaproteobacteria bacterium]
MELSKAQKEIIEHTIKTGLYCGGSADMDLLCELGYMEFAGKKSFVPDPYYRATQKGKKAI